MPQDESPDPDSIRKEIRRVTKTLEEQTQLLLVRMWATQVRLKALDAKLREFGKNYKAEK